MKKKRRCQACHRRTSYWRPTRKQWPSITVQSVPAVASLRRIQQRDLWERGDIRTSIFHWAYQVLARVLITRKRRHQEFFEKQELLRMPTIGSQRGSWRLLEFSSRTDFRDGKELVKYQAIVQEWNYKRLGVHSISSWGLTSEQAQ